jgi:hypothetical protein
MLSNDCALWTPETRSPQRAMMNLPLRRALVSFCPLDPTAGQPRLRPGREYVRTCTRVSAQLCQRRRDQHARGPTVNGSLSKLAEAPHVQGDLAGLSDRDEDLPQPGGNQLTGRRDRRGLGSGHRCTGTVRRGGTLRGRCRVPTPPRTPNCTTSPRPAPRSPGSLPGHHRRSGTRNTPRHHRPARSRHPAGPAPPPFGAADTGSVQPGLRIRGCCRRHFGARVRRV